MVRPSGISHVSNNERVGKINEGRELIEEENYISCLEKLYDDIINIMYSNRNKKKC